MLPELDSPPSLHYMWHLPSRAVSSDTSEESSVQTTPPRGLRVHIGCRQVERTVLFLVGDLHRSSHKHLSSGPPSGGMCATILFHTRRSRRAKDLIRGGVKCGIKSASVVYLRCNTRDQSLTRRHIQYHFLNSLATFTSHIFMMSNSHVVVHISLFCCLPFFKWSLFKI